jgi:hypothetical protein
MFPRSKSNIPPLVSAGDGNAIASGLVFRLPKLYGDEFESEKLSLLLLLQNKSMKATSTINNAIPRVPSTRVIINVCLALSWLAADSALMRLVAAGSGTAVVLVALEMIVVNDVDVVGTEVSVIRVISVDIGWTVRTVGIGIVSVIEPGSVVNRQRDIAEDKMKVLSWEKMFQFRL